MYYKSGEKIEGPFTLKSLKKNVVIFLDRKKVTVNRFDRWPEEMKIKHGYKPYKAPVLGKYQEAGELIEKEKYFTREVLDKQVDLEKEKEKFLKEIRDKTKEKLYDTDPYIIDNFARKKPIPEDVIEERKSIHEKCDNEKRKIANITTFKELVEYEKHKG